MKNLLILRHAKTMPVAASGADFDRTLTERGMSDAMRVGQYINQKRISIDFVISSAAKRARQTTELVMQAAEITAQVVYDQRLYEAGPGRLLEVVATIDPQMHTVLLVGHNPGLEDLLRLLTGGIDPMATSTLALITISEDDWGRLMAGNCKLEWIVDVGFITQALGSRGECHAADSQ